MDNGIYEFSFIDFRLLSVHFELKTDKQYKLTKDVNISTTLTLNHDFFPKKKNLKLIIKIEACGDDLPFFINVEVAGLFNFPNYKTDIDLQKLDRIARINCAAIIFPYLREAVADIVRRSGLPQLNLPPINFVELYDIKSKAKTKEIK
jgi:preprotein translocase subunit SecB